MKDLKELLRKESLFQLSEVSMNSFLMQMSEYRLRSKSTLIATGSIDTSVYIVKNGIFRIWHMDGDKEITTGFATPGTMMASWFSYYHNRPSYFQIDACCDSVVLQLPKPEFDKLIVESHEFAQWALSMLQSQMYQNELKESIINGTAKERYLSLVKNQPEILKRVPLGVVASYVGITQQYLSFLRKQIADEQLESK